MPHNVLVVDSGARGHALVWSMKQDDECGKIYMAPGNGGTREIAQNVPIKTDVEALARFAQEKKIDLTVVGDEELLALGIVNEFRRRGLTIFGPTKEAEMIETSKIAAKELFVQRGIPTASSHHFSDHGSAEGHVEKVGVPIVIKADGLASGKGVYVCHDKDEAFRRLHEVMIQQVHGPSGTRVVIERFLRGSESSPHTLTDGERHVLLPTTWQDHKTLGPATAEHPEGTGPMTGGMGTYSPVPWMTPEVMHDVDNRIVTPTFDELRKRGIPFTGCLFTGLMMTADGPMVLEMNGRPGDPETQSWMRTMRHTLQILHACALGKLDPSKISMATHAVACLVLAARGYPGTPEKGDVITGIDDARGDPDIEVFHAGTIFDEERGLLLTNGGRVLSVTAIGDTLPDALRKARSAADNISFRNARGEDTKYIRPDIGHQALAPA